MSDTQIIGCVNAVVYATEEVANKLTDKGDIMMIKEHAYNQIQQIMSGKIPWQEEGQKVGGE